MDIPVPMLEAVDLHMYALQHQAMDLPICDSILLTEREPKRMI